MHEFGLILCAKSSTVVALGCRCCARFPNFDFPIHPEEYTLSQFLYHAFPCATVAALSVGVSQVVSVKLNPKTQIFSSGFHCELKTAIAQVASSTAITLMHSQTSSTMPNLMRVLDTGALRSCLSTIQMTTLLPHSQVWHQQRHSGQLSMLLAWHSMRFRRRCKLLLFSEWRVNWLVAVPVCKRYVSNRFIQN